MSDVYMLNRVGDSTPPWGTPVLNCFVNDLVLLYVVKAFRPFM